MLALLARGLLTKQVAKALGISVKTADRHVQNISPRSGCPPAPQRRCSPWSTPGDVEELMEDALGRSLSLGRARDRPA